MRTNEKLNAHLRILVLCICDAIIITACAYVALLLRFAPDGIMDNLKDVTKGVPRLIVCYLGVNAIFGLYHVRWRHMTNVYLIKQVLACIVGFGTSFIWEELRLNSLTRRYYLLIAFALILCGICCFRMLLKLIRDIEFKKKAQEISAERCVMTIEADKQPGKLLLTVRDMPKTVEMDGLVKNVYTNEVTDIIIKNTFSDEKTLEKVTEICLETGCFVKVV